MFGSDSKGTSETYFRMPKSRAVWIRLERFVVCFVGFPVPTRSTNVKYFFYLFLFRLGYLQCRPVYYLGISRTNEATISEIFFMRLFSHRILCVSCWWWTMHNKNNWIIVEMKRYLFACITVCRSTYNSTSFDVIVKYIYKVLITLNNIQWRHPFHSILPKRMLIRVRMRLPFIVWTANSFTTEQPALVAHVESSLLPHANT